MSKKIDAAAEDLVVAIYRHATALGAKSLRMGKVAQANTELLEAANAYSRIVYSKTDLVVPFGDVDSPEDEETVRDSLARERDEFVEETIRDGEHQ